MKKRSTYATEASTVYRIFEIHKLNEYNESQEKPTIVKKEEEVKKTKNRN